MEPTSLYYVDLSSVELGKPFDGMAAGKFRDMWGLQFEIKPSELSEFVENTRANIKATKTASGELVGLPIDLSNHDRGDAAGWIVDVSQEGNVLQFVPRWTELGSDSIRKGLRRMFSPTIDLANKAILGGSLTNWPASRDGKGKILLRPLELSMSILTTGETLEGDEAPEDTSSTPPQTMEGTPADKGAQSLHPEGDHMKTLAEMTEEEMVELIKKTVTSVQPAPVTPPTPVQPTPADLSDLFGLEGLTEEAKTQRKAELRQQLAGIRKQAELEYRAELARLQFENSMTDLAQSLTMGSKDLTRGLPISSEDLKAHLVKLAPDEAKFWGDLMTKTAKEGFVDFGELGSNEPGKGIVDLPVEVSSKLDTGEITLADLSSPYLGLGDLAQYNLTKWKKESK